MVQVLINIALQILEKFLGYGFICKVLVAVLELWAKSTKTNFDDKVFKAMAEALGVDSKVLKDLSEIDPNVKV